MSKSHASKRVFQYVSLGKCAYFRLLILLLLFHSFHMQCFFGFSINFASPFGFLFEKKHHNLSKTVIMNLTTTVPSDCDGILECREAMYFAIEQFRSASNSMLNQLLRAEFI